MSVKDEIEKFIPDTMKYGFKIYPQDARNVAETTTENGQTYTRYFTDVDFETTYQTMLHEIGHCLDRFYKDDYNERECDFHERARRELLANIFSVIVMC